MANIKVTPAELRASAAKFDQKSQQTQDAINTLNSEVLKLASIWEGLSQKAFTAEYDSLKQPLGQFVTLTQRISAQLKDVANTMEQTDQTIASRLK